MSFPLGKSPLETLGNFRAYQWFAREFKKFALRVATEYASRNEVTRGLVLSKGGTVDTDNLQLSMSAGKAVINGVIMTSGALTNAEGVATPGAILGLITEAGAAAGALTAASVDYYITFIASNSTGAGTVNADDGDTLSVHGILSASASHISSGDINSALAASSGNATNYDHSAATGWCHLCQVKFDSDFLSGSQLVLNRNNILGA